MKTTKLIIKTKSKTYPIFFGNNILSQTGNLMKKNLPGTKKICVISDNKIPNSFLKKLINSLNKYEVKVYKLNANEKTKSLRVANKIIEWLLNNNFNRSDCVIGFGGGVIGDLSAFISNLTKRGLKFINIPTTLLAQVDASVGGKTGINSNQGKNLIGTFYQPDFILSDISMLKSLPQREIISGYGEILKHSLILDKKFFLWLTKNGKRIVEDKNKMHLIDAIYKSCCIKNFVVQQDEKEKDLRMILNFGHTFAHGIEAAANFSRRINHGEAVLIGMYLATNLSFKKKICSLSTLNEIKKLYTNNRLPLDLKRYFSKTDLDKIVKYMAGDKKNIDEKINLILLKSIGKTSKPGEFRMKVRDMKKPTEEKPTNKKTNKMSKSQKRHMRKSK